MRADGRVYAATIAGGGTLRVQRAGRRRAAVRAALGPGGWAGCGVPRCYSVVSLGPCELGGETGGVSTRPLLRLGGGPLGWMVLLAVTTGRYSTVLTLLILCVLCCCRPALQVDGRNLLFPNGSQAGGGSPRIVFNAGPASTAFTSNEPQPAGCILLSSLCAGRQTYVACSTTGIMAGS